jgi:hypothetical protein
LNSYGSGRVPGRFAGCPSGEGKGKGKGRHQASPMPERQERQERQERPSSEQESRSCCRI